MKASIYVHGVEAYGQTEKRITYEELDKIIEKKVLPRVKTLKNGKRSISLHNILKDQELNTEALEYIANYLEGLDIIVRGKNSTIDEIDNYEYTSTYKNLKKEKEKSLSKEENLKLFMEYKAETDIQKKMQIRDEIIAGNMSLVPWMLWKIAFKNNIPLDELCSYGYEGLMKAVSNYNYSLGYAFSTYACHWIYFYAFDAIVENYAYLPRNDYQIYFDISEARELLLEMGEEINPSKIIEIIETVRGVKFNKKKREYLLSNLLINFPAYMQTEELDKFEDTTQIVFDKVANKALKESIWKSLDYLTEREKKVLILRFGLDRKGERTLDEVGLELGGSRERIRQIEAKALRKLRHPRYSKKIKDFVA